MNEFIHTFFTKTGVQVYVRPIQPDDTPFLVDIFQHMGSESRYRRFLQAVDHVSEERIWQEAERIAHTDPQHSGSLLAFVDLPDAPQTPIAAARYVEMEPETAEIALSVRDDWQSMGIGTQLLKELVEIARRAGFVCLVGMIQNDNEAIKQVLRRLPYRVQFEAEGTISNIEVLLQETADFKPVKSTGRLYNTE